MSITLPVDRFGDLWSDRLQGDDLRLIALLHSASVIAALEPTLSVFDHLSDLPWWLCLISEASAILLFEISNVRFL